MAAAVGVGFLCVSCVPEYSPAPEDLQEDAGKILPLPSPAMTSSPPMSGVGGNGGSASSRPDPVGGGNGGTGGSAGAEETPTQCTTGQSSCGEVCVDLRVSTEHCGACGHDCLGGSCANGVCQSVTLASGKGRLFMVAVDETAVYYGGDGTTIGRVGKDGTGDTTLATREFAYSWALTPMNLVWGDPFSAQGLRACRLPTCNGGPVAATQPIDFVVGAAYSPANGRLYWALSGATAGEVRSRIEPTGAEATFAGFLGLLVTDESFLYGAVTEGDQVAIRRVPLGGGAATTLTFQPSVTLLAVSDDNLYFVNELGTIFVRSLQDGLSDYTPRGFAAPAGTVRYLAADSSHLYWAIATGSLTGGSGSIVRCPHGGCSTPETLSPTTGRPWSLALDDDAVYWVTESGAVQKLAKP